MTMSHYIPKRCAVLITRTKKPPIRISFWPLSIGLLLILGWTGILLYYSYSIEVARSNSRALLEQASDLSKRINTLEVQLDSLSRRVGIEKNKTVPNRSTYAQGGIGQHLGTEELLEAADQQLDSVDALKGVVMPAVGDFVARRAAAPYGMPLLAPVRFSSFYGARPSPFGGKREFHTGIDMAVPSGTPIYATAPGVVLAANFAGGYGNRVLLDHGYELKTLYGHLSKISIKPGAWIERGQLIGYVGSTGRSSGPHLHYGVYSQRKPVDPKPYLEMNSTLADK
jgi:murein DD-endopeptidase MepM/ murein hydrolase activator NlpD